MTSQTTPKPRTWTPEQLASGRRACDTCARHNRGPGILRCLSPGYVTRCTEYKGPHVAEVCPPSFWKGGPNR